MSEEKKEAVKEEKKEMWLNYVALTTVIFAVCAALSTFKGGQASTKTVLNQSKASNQWAYYQAKDIKSYLYELQMDDLQLKLKSVNATMPPEVQEDYNKKFAFYNAKIKKYDGEKDKIEKQARGLEKEMEAFQKSSQAFGMAIIFLQIAILLSSVAALLRKKPLWLGGMCVGVFGIAYFANGFFLFF